MSSYGVSITGRRHGFDSRKNRFNIILYHIKLINTFNKKTLAGHFYIWNVSYDKIVFDVDFVQNGNLTNE